MSKVNQNVRSAMKKAVSKGEPWCGANTCILPENGIIKCYLHGHYIFRYNTHSKKAEWDDAGFPTRTTVARLNDMFIGVGSKTVIHRKLVNKKWITFEEASNAKK